MKIFKFFLLFSCIGTIQAQTHSPYDNSWKVDVTPYLWAINMNGTVQVGPARTHLNQDFGDILKNFNYGGMLWVDAYKNNLGIFVNALYASLGNNFKDGPVKVDANNQFGLFSGGLSYKVYDCHAFSVEPYAGFRYTLNDTTVKLSIPSLFYLRSTNNKHWTDPIIGARLRYDFTKAWSVTLAGDIGGTNASKQYSYNLIGLLGYSPQTVMTNTTAYLGYRLLDQHYITGSGLNYYNWNMKIFGPLIGIAFKF